jgi:lysophospholipase L1-like esterase
MLKRGGHRAFLIIALAIVISAYAVAARAADHVCEGPINLTQFDRPLIHVGQRLAAREPIKIVAMGSSSTAGAGASSPAASYPSRLAVELEKLYPNVPITVLNRGINGQDVAEMIARFKHDVIDERPDLVIWQLGTNAALRNLPMEEVGKFTEQGIREVKTAGADILLVDPQFVPKVIAKPEAEGIVRLITTTAILPRSMCFAALPSCGTGANAMGMSFDAFTSPDGLHMNDWGYGCWAKLLGTAISEAAMRVVTSAHAVPASVHTNNKSSDPVASFFVVLSPLCPLPRRCLPSPIGAVQQFCSAASN